MKTHRVLSSPTFKSSLPPKQERELKGPKHQNWKIWAKDYWDEFASDCRRAGLEERFLDSMQKIKNNRDNGILVMDRYYSGFRADNYVIGLYDNVKAIEKDRKNGVCAISNTRNGSKYLYYGIDASEPHFNVKGSLTDERIKFPNGLSHVERMLTIIERIADPTSKEANHIGIKPIPKVLEIVTKMRIKK